MLNTIGTGNGTPANDIAGTVAAASAFNLVGTGGAGGLTGGVNHNQVGVAKPGLGVLANNGGPTPTIALLPGSPAIGAGSSTIAGVTVPKTDQRGVARPMSSVDIGAFQDRGFLATIVTGESPQTAAIKTSFANPLAVFVTSPFGDPVQGGTITFTVTPAAGGASANLSAGSATIGAGGLTSVTAVANSTVGSYTATASARGVASPAVFALTNLAQAVGVTGVSVAWGTQTAGAPDRRRRHPVAAGRPQHRPALAGYSARPDRPRPGATLTPSDVTVTSAIGVSYGPVTVSGSGTSYTITLAQAINKADRVTITIASATIATFTRRLDVLPGDFNDDGVVNSQDLVDVRNEWLGVNGAKATIFGDLNGDGKVDVNDYSIVRAASGTSLPTLAPPASPSALLVTTPGASSGGTGQIAAVPTALGSSVLPAADSRSPDAPVSSGRTGHHPDRERDNVHAPGPDRDDQRLGARSKAARRTAAEVRSMKRAEIRLANRGRG